MYEMADGVMMRPFEPAVYAADDRCRRSFDRRFIVIVQFSGKDAPGDNASVSVGGECSWLLQFRWAN